MADFTALIRSLPKAELHVHLEGCVTPEHVIEIGRRNGIVLFESLGAAQAAYKASSLEDFLKIFSKASEVLLHADDFTGVATAYFDKAAAEGVRHIELMFDLQAHTSRGVSIGTVIKGLTKAQEHASHRGLSIYLIVNFMRERDEEEALELLTSLEPYRQHITAIGIDSAETGYPPRKFVRLYQKALSIGLRLVAHAGFEGPPEDIEEAVDLLHVDRVDHGNRIYEKPELAKRLGDSEYAITVCPHAEVQLEAVSSLAEHPVRRMLQDGMRPSVHSDDPAWFGSITKNYADLAREAALTREEVFQLVRNSFTTSFLPETSMKPYLDEIAERERGGLAA